MRWPLSKKPDQQSIPPRDAQRWTVAQGEYGGAPLVLRVNEAARALVGDPRFPIKLGFALPLNHPNVGGLPQPQENSLLAGVEDTIVEAVLGAASGLHAMTLTTGEMKEFVFYIAPGADIRALHMSLRNSVRSHDVQCMALQEPDWDSFREFVP